MLPRIHEIRFNAALNNVKCRAYIELVTYIQARVTTMVRQKAHAMGSSCH